jgi:hypothetical protein
MFIITGLTTGKLFLTDQFVLGVIFSSLYALCFIIGTIALILSLGEYKPHPYPPTMPAPMFTGNMEYCIVYLHEDYWTLSYYEQIESASEEIKNLKGQHVLHIILCRRSRHHAKQYMIIAEY